MKKCILTALLCLASHQASALCLPIACSCNVSTTPLSFAPFDPLPGNVQDATGSVTVSCSGVAGLVIPYSIALNSGAGTIGSRKMINGARNLYYNVYSNSNHSTIWGDGTTGAPVVSGSILLNLLGTISLPHTTYGRINAGQKTLVPGVYNDTLTVTLTYQ